MGDWNDSIWHLSTLRDQVQLLWMSCTRQPTPWRSIWRRCRSVARKDLTYWAARDHSKTLHQTWRGHPVVSFGGWSNRKRHKQNLKTWGETLQNLHPPMMWAHIDWVGRVVRSVASSKVAMMMWLWQHSHAWKHGTREVTFTLRFEDVWLSSEHTTSLFWKQVSKFFTLCFHENSLRQHVLPFRSALFRPRSFFSSRKPRAVTWGRHSGGAGWVGGPWWQDSIYTCRPRHSCLGLLLKWMMPWCFQVLARGHFFTRSRGVAYSARPIYVIGRYTSQLPCHMQAVYRCPNEACPWYQPKKLPCNFSIPISIQNLPPWSLHCGGPWGKWFLQWSRRWIKWRFAPGWKIGSLSV